VGHYTSPSTTALEPERVDDDEEGRGVFATVLKQIMVIILISVAGVWCAWQAAAETIQVLKKEVVREQLIEADLRQVSPKHDIGLFSSGLGGMGLW
jgi:hypothetical protein